MQILGDEAGIAVLHEMKTSSKEYLKFLIQEARTVFGNQVDFKAKDGSGYVLVWSPHERTFSVLRK